MTSNCSISKLLLANDTEISGWAYDERSEEPVMVSVLINGVEAVSLRADRQNHYRKTATGENLPCGFKLEVHDSLRKRLPPENAVEARTHVGDPIPPGAEFICELTGYEGVGPAQLKKALDDGSIISPKSGMLMRPLAARGGWGMKALLAYQEAAEAMRETLGREMFIAYGTLLGLVRENGLIGHDDDVDAMFMLDANDPFAAGHEFVEMAKRLGEAGHNIARVLPGGNLHWRTSNGIVLDIFGCWSDGATLNGYMFSFPGSTPDVFPLKHDKLLGQDVMAPANAEQFLEGVYGVDWRTPDPQFQWQPDHETLKRMTEFGRAVKEN